MYRSRLPLTVWYRMAMSEAQLSRSGIATAGRMASTIIEIRTIPIAKPSATATTTTMVMTCASELLSS
jgi:hypothetical protein